MITIISSLILPIILLLVACLILFSKKNLFQHFLDGAVSGAKSAFSLVPTLVALLVAIGMFNESGAVNILVPFLAPVANLLRIPSQLLPMLIVRPFSGSATSAMLNDIFTNYGPDSFLSLCACIIMGSSDTVVYIVSVYFSSVGISKTRYTLFAALVTMLFSMILSCVICSLFFA